MYKFYIRYQVVFLTDHWCAHGILSKKKKKNLFFGTYLSFERIYPLNVAASPLNREPLRHCIIAEVCTGTSTLSFVYE